MSNGLTIANDLTDEGGCDGTISLTLVGQTGPIDSSFTDKSYDQIGFYEAA